jgi:hypothetical protein
MIGDMPPNELNALLNHVEGYENGNMLRWWAVPKVLPLRLETLQDCMYVPAPVDDMLKYLYKGIPIICRVDDWQGIPNDAKQHWVLWVDQYEYIDPYDGLTKQMVNPSRNVLYWAVYTPFDRSASIDKSIRDNAAVWSELAGTTTPSDVVIESIT